MNDSGRAAARRRDAAILAFQRSYGQRIPDYVFPARITGIARVANSSDETGTVVNAPVSDGPCVDSVEEPPDDCGLIQTPNADGFFPPDVLPCGLTRVRYRWQALHDPALNSEGCGIRQLDDGTFAAWRQAFYAVNQAEFFYPGDLPFPYIRPGSNVHIAFGPIGRFSGQTNEWGFYFNLTADPKGATECPSSNLGGDVTGCCQVRIVATGQVINEFCEQPQFCIDPVGDPNVIYQYLGDGVDCGVFPNDCTSPTDLETVCCTLLDVQNGNAEIASFCDTRQNCLSQVAPGFIDVSISTERDPCGFESCNYGGSGGERRIGNPIHDSNGRLVITYDGRLGTCQD